MNKKVIILIGILLMCIMCMTGCTIGNRHIGLDTTQTFRWASIELGNGELIEGPVSSWRDFNESDAVQVTINGITYLTHYSKVILQTQAP